MTVYGGETHLLIGKEKAPGTVVSKEGFGYNVLCHERIYVY